MRTKIRSRPHTAAEIQYPPQTSARTRNVQILSGAGDGTRAIAFSFGETPLTAPPPMPFALHSRSHNTFENSSGSPSEPRPSWVEAAHRALASPTRRSYTLARISRTARALQLSTAADRCHIHNTR